MTALTYKDHIQPEPKSAIVFHFLQHRRSSDDLEFSDLGRDPRFLPAWWLWPVLAVAVTLTVWIANVL